MTDSTNDHERMPLTNWRRHEFDARPNDALLYADLRTRGTLEDRLTLGIEGNDAEARQRRHLRAEDLIRIESSRRSYAIERGEPEPRLFSLHTISWENGDLARVITAQFIGEHAEELGFDNSDLRMIGLKNGVTHDAFRRAEDDHSELEYRARREEMGEYEDDSYYGHDADDDEVEAYKKTPLDWVHAELTALKWRVEEWVADRRDARSPAPAQHEAPAHHQDRTYGPHGPRL